MPQNEHTGFGKLLTGKVVVADTSSLLIAGTLLLSKIENCELVIPSIVVTELEAKRHHPTLGYLAREWINLLEDLRLDHKLGLAKGVEISNGVVIRVEPNHKNQQSLPVHLRDGSVDATILAVAHNLDKDAAVVPEVVLLSNDTPMRLKATLDINLDAYEFVAYDLDKKPKYTGRVSVVLSQEEYVNLGLPGHSPQLEALSDHIKANFAKDLGYHTMVDVFLQGSDEPTHQLLFENGVLSEIPRKESANKIFGKTIEQDVALRYLKAPAKDLPIVSIGGSAGTGKTLLTVATALQGIKERQYHKIVVFRSLHEMGMGQEMGFLPGDVEAKMGPWAGAIKDALDVIAETRKPVKKNEGVAAVENRKKLSEQLAEDIEVSPITYLRGRSLANSFIILDEAQNFSRAELLNIISRVGEGSKLALLGDPLQVDNKYLQSGDKAEIWSIIDSFKDIDLFAHVTLQKTERSRLADLAAKMLEFDS